MRKLPSYYDNPIDNMIINFCEYMSPLYDKLSLTPNILTTISLLLAILAVILFYNDYYVLSAIIFFISYIFDCCDGHFARKYNKITKFGCYYDHFSDILKYILFGIAMYQKSSSRFFFILPIFALFFILSLIHTGCMEVYTDDNIQSHSLNFFKKLCPCDADVSLKITRYFGFGTFTVIFLIFIISYADIKQ